MTSNEIFDFLTRQLGPLKLQPQDDESQFEKFQELLAFTLSQTSFEFRKSDVRFPDSNQAMLPEDVSDALEKMTNDTVMQQAARKPADPVYLLRQRSLPVIAGVEERLENFVEPEVTFGPFINPARQKTWFDFFRVPKQLRFETLLGGIADFLVITFPADADLPAAGSHDSLSIADCTVWILAKAVAPNADKLYTGVRAKSCEVIFQGISIVQPTGFVTVLAPTFQLSFVPFDEFANGAENDQQPKADYPGKIVFSFAGTNCSLLSVDASAININGDRIDFGAAQNSNPVYLEEEGLVRFPLIANKDTWEIFSNETERFQLMGKTTGLTDAGWYLPVVSTDNSLSIGVLGMALFSGYLGFRGKDGMELTWPGLENGKLRITDFLLLVRPGRARLNYTYTASSRTKQQLSLWKRDDGNDDRNSILLKPLPAANGICLSDNQQLEALLQPVSITAAVDRPLNSAQKRFDINGNTGAAFFTKVNAETSVVMVGNNMAAPGEEKKRRLPQSLCLQNALLTTDNPRSVFIEGNALVSGVITDGTCYLTFPVYRLVNMLPDPYISNQDDLFDVQELFHFNELWRSGNDTLPDTFLFTVTSQLQWNEDDASLAFHMGQQVVTDRVLDAELLNVFPNAPNLCAGVNLGLAGDVPIGDVHNLRTSDTSNVVGAFEYLQWLPGDRCLVDVSGRANQWGVSFSINVTDDKKILAETVSFAARFPFRIKGLELVSSGRLSRLFTLPHIQWEPVMQIPNPDVNEADIPPIVIFNSNGNPTRISSASKAEVSLVPSKIYSFLLDGFNNADKPVGAAAHFTLPFGICAIAYFNPKTIVGLPSAIANANEPEFSGKKTGDVSGAMQLQVKATPPARGLIRTFTTPVAYFIGSARLVSGAMNGPTSILGKTISNSFAEFASGASAKVPLQRIDFSGYGASIFSNWRNDQANFGRVNQVKFDVMIGRTAHEVVQIKSILFPWGVPVVRSIVMQRKNSGIVIRHDSGWVAQGPGEFNFLSHATGAVAETNPYNFHPGMVTGIYNVTEIREVPEEMDIFFTVAGKQIRFSGVYFNGDIEIENISKGALPKSEDEPSRIHSAGQFGYVMLADPSLVTDTTTLATLFPPPLFKQLLNDPKIGGSLGGPVNATMNVAATGQRMQITRVDVSASNEATPSFVVAVRGTVELPKEGSWTVVKCLPSKDVVPLTTAEIVPVIRNGLLSINAATGLRNIQFAGSRHSIGDPAEIDKYVLNAVPALQYGFLQTTDTQKLLFRRPSFDAGKPQVLTDVPDLADAFRLLNNQAIFPNLSKTLSLPDSVTGLNIVSDGAGLKFDDALFAGGNSLNDFVPKQLTLPIPDSQVYKILDESGFQVYISYQSKEAAPSSFKVDLSSDAIDEVADGARKKWQTVNKGVAVVVNLGSIKPLLTLRGQFRSEAGSIPLFENPECELGPALQAVKDILQVLALLAGKADEVADSLHVTMGNSPNAWSYKMSIDQRIPVIQFPSTEEITLSTPPPLIIEASLTLGIFFNLSLSPDPKNLIKPGAGAVFGFEGMIQIQLITIGIAAAYGVGITKVKAYVDLTDPKPQFEFTFGFGATVIVDLPVVGLVSVTRSFSLTGNIDSGDLLIVAGQMLRGVLSLAGGLLVVAIQIEGKAGVQRKTADPDNQSTVALFAMIFSLDVSLAFVISYDFTKTYSEEITLS